MRLHLANNADLVSAKTGRLTSERVRRLQLSGIVDLKVLRLVLPSHVVVALRLPVVGTIKAQLPDGRQVERTFVEQVRVEIQGRSSVFTAIVEPDRTDAVIGRIVLTELDLVLDHTGQNLVPRDPRGILTEIE